MQSKATTVKAYLASLPADRRKALEAVRKVIRANLDSGYEEGTQYGSISYHVPHRVYPAGYHCNPAMALPFVALASQKQYMAFYLMCCYQDPEHEAWFREQWAKTGKKLNMGKSCVRFKSIDELALDVIGKAIKRVPARKFIKRYEASLEGTPAGLKLARRKAAAESGTKKTATARKAATAKKAKAKKAAPKRKTAGRRKST